MKKLAIATMITLMIIGMGATTFARNGRGGGPGMGGPGMGGHGMGPGGMGAHPLLHADWQKIVDVAGDVGITQEQLDALSKLRSDFRNTNSDLQMNLRNKQQDFQELMVTATAADKSKAMKLADEIHALQGHLMKNGLEATFQIKQIFTPDQLNKLRDIVRERREEKREERREDRQGRRGGRGGDRGGQMEQQPGGDW